MRIIIPVSEDKHTESEVFKNFEKSNLFAFIDLYEESYNVDIKEKDFTNLGLEEIKDFLVKENIEVVIADQIEDELCKFLSNEKIMVVYEAKGKIENIIGAFSAMLSNQENSCSGNCGGCADHDHDDACCTTDEQGCGGCH